MAETIAAYCALTISIATLCLGYIDGRRTSAQIINDIHQNLTTGATASARGLLFEAKVSFEKPLQTGFINDDKVGTPEAAQAYYQLIYAIEQSSCQLSLACRKSRSPIPGRKCSPKKAEHLAWHLGEIEDTALWYKNLGSRINRIHDDQASHLSFERARNRISKFDLGRPYDGSVR